MSFVRIGDKGGAVKPLDLSVRDAFSEAVRKQGVPSGEVADYLKWLRYYLDYCAKYRCDAIVPESLQGFLLKLASKNQSAAQQDQAARSVKLYLKLAARPSGVRTPPPKPAGTPARRLPARPANGWRPPCVHGLCACRARCRAAAPMARGIAVGRRDPADPGRSETPAVLVQDV